MPSNKQSDLQTRLKYCRQKSGLTHSQIADALGVNRSTYTYYERGRSEPSLDTLTKLSVIFNTDLMYLLGHETLPRPINDNTINISDINSKSDKEDDTAQYMNMLTKDERSLIIKFRMLKDNQKEEILANFGITRSIDNPKNEN